MPARISLIRASIAGSALIALSTRGQSVRVVSSAVCVAWPAAGDGAGASSRLQPATATRVAVTNMAIRRCCMGESLGRVRIAPGGRITPAETTRAATALVGGAMVLEASHLEGDAEQVLAAVLVVFQRRGVEVSAVAEVGTLHRAVGLIGHVV